MDTNYDVFDILGISRKEDSYTNLVKYLFDNWNYFKQKFIEEFAENTKDEFELETRNTYSLINDIDIEINVEHHRKKILPDMILHSKKEIIIIENKIFSGEGYKQTIEYSSKKYLDVVERKFNIKHAKFNFYFMTLDGIKAYSPNFKSIKWSKLIANCCKETSEIEKYPRLKILVDDLVQRCKQYENIPEPADNESICTYLNKRTKFITTEKLFKIYMTEVLKDIVPKYNFYYDFSTSDNRNGHVSLVYLYKKDWRGIDIEKAKQGDSCRFIHIEFNMPENLKEINLCIHYEGYPYKTAEEWNNFKKKEDFKEIIENYEAERNIFKGNIYSKLNPNWKRVGRCITLVETSISKEVELQEIKKWAEENVEFAYKLIEEFK